MGLPHIIVVVIDVVYNTVVSVTLGSSLFGMAFDLMRI